MTSTVPPFSTLDQYSGISLPHHTGLQVQDASSGSRVSRQTESRYIFMSKNSHSKSLRNSSAAERSRLFSQVQKFKPLCAFLTRNSPIRLKLYTSVTLPSVQSNHRRLLLAQASSSLRRRGSRSTSASIATNVRSQHGGITALHEASRSGQTRHCMRWCIGIVQDIW